MLYNGYMNKPLQGLKILDFTSLLPGPYATMLLADFGAEIIKVENLLQPDLTRFVPPFHDNISVLNAHLNRGKKSLSLNLKKKEARQIIYSLVNEYDIIVEQFRPGVMTKLGLGYDDLKEINPPIIYCSLTGYGQTGSYAQRAGHDINYMALSGLESFSGRKEEGPSLSGLQIADIAGGAKNLAMAVMAAVIKRMKSGKGDYIDVSITDSTFAMTLFCTAPFLHGGKEPGPEEEILNGGALYDYYETADGRYLAAGPIEPKFFKAFCESAGCPQFSDEGIGNVKVKGEIAKIIKKKTLPQWEKIFCDADSCVEPVLTIAETITRPPLAERNMVVNVKGNDSASFRQIGNPVKFQSVECVAEKAGVERGLHNEEILKQAGFRDKEINFFREHEIIG